MERDGSAQDTPKKEGEGGRGGADARVRCVCEGIWWMDVLCVSGSEVGCVNGQNKTVPFQPSVFGLTSPSILEIVCDFLSFDDLSRIRFHSSIYCTFKLNIF